VNNCSESNKEISRSSDRIKNTGFFANKLERLKEKDYTCPFCREVLNGIAAFGRHLKGHCT
jgi:hypothetical protein